MKVFVLLLVSFLLGLVPWQWAHIVGIAIYGLAWYNMGFYLKNFISTFLGRVTLPLISEGNATFGVFGFRVMMVLNLISIVYAAISTIFSLEHYLEKNYIILVMILLIVIPFGIGAYKNRIKFPKNNI